MKTYSILHICRWISLCSILICFLNFKVHSQWTETCFDVFGQPQIEEGVLVPFCNDTTGFEYYPGTEQGDWPYTDPYMDNETGPFNFECHQINYDIWGHFTYPEDANGYMCLSIMNGTCEHPEGLVGNYGPLDGWVMILWQGETCEDAELVWSTNCYWMTEEEPGIIGPNEYLGIGDYDPTRQEWYIEMFNITPGTEFIIQIDGFGWCQGCGDFYWCSEMNLLSILQFEVSGTPGPPVFEVETDELTYEIQWSNNTQTWLPYYEDMLVEGWNYFRVVTPTDISGSVAHWYQQRPELPKDWGYYQNFYQTTGQRIR